MCHDLPVLSMLKALNAALHGFFLLVFIAFCEGLTRLERLIVKEFPCLMQPVSP